MVQPKVTGHRVLGLILARFIPITIMAPEWSIKKSTLKLHIICLQHRCILCIVDHCTITGTNVWHTVFIDIFVIYIYNYMYIHI